MTKTAASAKPKPRNSQDSTVRNLRVTRRDVADLVTLVTRIEQALVTIRQEQVRARQPKRISAW